MRLQRGFSLVELIITLVILGTLAVTVVPKFFSIESFDAFSTRDRIMTAMRTMQLRAMQNTSEPCHKLYFTDTQVAPPTPDNCSASIDVINNPDYFVIELVSAQTDTRITRKDSNNVTFNSVTFDEFGNPDLDCSNLCRIDLGEADICMSDAGGIYACN